MESGKTGSTKYQCDFYCRITCLPGKQKQVQNVSQKKCLISTSFLRNSSRSLQHKDGVELPTNLQKILFSQDPRMLFVPPLILIAMMKMKSSLFFVENQTVDHQVLMSARLRQVKIMLVTSERVGAISTPVVPCAFFCGL